MYIWYENGIDDLFLKMAKYLKLLTLSLLLIQYDVKGDIDIVSTQLNLKGTSEEETTLPVQLGSINPTRIRWLNSSITEDSLPTSQENILIQLLSPSTISCPGVLPGPDENNMCGKFKLDNYGLVFTTVDFSDGEQKFWIEVITALGGISVTHAVPKVCDSGSTELSSPCTFETCTCTASMFAPATSFTLEWMKDGSKIEGINNTEQEGNYFSARSTISENKAGNYTCCANGDAYYFENSKKSCTSAVTIKALPDPTNKPTTEQPGSSPVRVSRETMIVIGVIGCVILAIMIPVVVCLIRYKLGYRCENCKPDDPEPTTTNVTCLLEDTHSQTKDKETKCINTEENKEDKKEEDTKDNKEEVAEDNKKDNKEEEKNEKA